MLYIQMANQDDLQWINFQYKKVNFAPSHFDNEEIDGTMIKRGDKKLVAKISTATPQLNDQITVAGVNYEYINHRDVSPDGNNIIYIIQVRI